MPVRILIVVDDSVGGDSTTRPGTAPAEPLRGEPPSPVGPSGLTFAGVDVSVLDRQGIAALLQLLQERPETKVLMLVVEGDAGVRGDLSARIVGGFAPGDPAEADIPAAMRSLAGRLVSSGLPEPAADEEPAPSVDPLSAREREVLGLLALGYTNHEIATALGISVRTAETHRACIMRKLKLSTRAELVRYALCSGLLGDRQ